VNGRLSIVRWLPRSQKAIVLLKNENGLPLSDNSESIAVLGPMIDTVAGDYSGYGMKVVSLLEGFVRRSRLRSGHSPEVVRWDSRRCRLSRPETFCPGCEARRIRVEGEYCEPRNDRNAGIRAARHERSFEWARIWVHQARRFCRTRPQAEVTGEYAWRRNGRRRTSLARWKTADRQLARTRRLLDRTALRLEPGDRMR
jgi:hypothetical protein